MEYQKWSFDLKEVNVVQVDLMLLTINKEAPGGWRSWWQTPHSFTNYSDGHTLQLLFSVSMTVKNIKSIVAIPKNIILNSVVKPQVYYSF